MSSHTLSVPGVSEVLAFPRSFSHPNLPSITPASLESESHSVVSDSVIPWTVPCQAPLSMEFSRQEYWSGLPFPSPGIFPTQGSNPGSLACCGPWDHKESNRTHRLTNSNSIWRGRYGGTDMSSEEKSPDSSILFSFSVGFAVGK